MRVAVRENTEDEFHPLAAQRAQVQVDRVELTFVNFAPLTQSPDGSVSDLVRKAEGGIAIVGFMHTADQRLEAVTRLNFEDAIGATDKAVIGFLGIGQ